MTRFPDPGTREGMVEPEADAREIVDTHQFRERVKTSCGPHEAKWLSSVPGDIVAETTGLEDE